MFAINSGHVVHARDCTAVYGPDRVTPDDPWNGLNGSKPLTQGGRQSGSSRAMMPLI